MEAKVLVLSPKMLWISAARSQSESSTYAITVLKVKEGISNDKQQNPIEAPSHSLQANL